jgi:hypothetical protein
MCLEKLSFEYFIKIWSINLYDIKILPYREDLLLNDTPKRDTTPHISK